MISIIIVTKTTMTTQCPLRRELTLRENATRPQNPNDLASVSDKRYRGRTAATAGTSCCAGDADVDGCTADRVTGTAAVVRTRTTSDTTSTGTADRTAAGTTKTTVSVRYRYAAVQRAAVVHRESRLLRLCNATAAVGKPLTGNVFVASSLIGDRLGGVGWLGVRSRGVVTSAVITRQVYYIMMRVRDDPPDKYCRHCRCCDGGVRLVEGWLSVRERVKSKRPRWWYTPRPPV